jgi:hypothetical protein
MPLESATGDKQTVCLQTAQGKSGFHSQWWQVQSYSQKGKGNQAEK